MHTFFSLTTLIIITQIITESLPISSSGHVMLILILAQNFWPKQISNLPGTLDSILNVSALVVIAINFNTDYVTLFSRLIKITYSSWIKNKKLAQSQRRFLFVFFKLIGLVFFADFITTIFYFLFKALFKNSYATTNSTILFFGFCITTLILISLKIKEKYFKAHSHFESLNFYKTTILGIVQGLALIPGISRFASTYVAGCWLNLGQKKAFQISFLIYFPLIITDILFHGIIPILKSPQVTEQLNVHFIVVASISTMIAAILLKLVYKIALKDKLWCFCFYMPIPIIILVAFFLTTCSTTLTKIVT